MEQLPSKAQILEWIADHPTQSSKREIAKAFGIKGSALRIELKRLLKDMEGEGTLAKSKRVYRDAAGLPPVSVLKVLAPDAAGDLFAEPLDWDGQGTAPRILMQTRASDALGEGDKILARLEQVEDEDHAYVGRLIRKIGSNPLRILGVFRAASEGGRIVPIDKKQDKEWIVGSQDTDGARDGELVEAEQSGPKRMGLPRARILARLGDPSAPRAISLIAIHQHGIPDHFPDAVVAEADAARPAPMGARTDLRDLPLVTIDPADARDHDDAVFAEAGPGGTHIVWVAIADVAHYVTPGSQLDREARRRGNSTYFPDRVVPMLPDTLSGDLCSLHEGVERPCLAVRMTLDAEGNKIDHRFVRGMMRSIASLTYGEVQAAQDGAPSDRVAPMMERIITPLYDAYAAAKAARERRQPLDLDLPERRIELTEDGKVSSVNFRERLDAHRLIEEFMVLANVAAAEELVRLKQPLLFRVHEEPSPDKLESLREVAQGAGFTLAKGQVLKTAHLNRLLSQAEGTDYDELMNISTLRSMTQAYYYPENFGHFGLALRNYAHFTSPIRRYSDLIVHRALISGHGWGKDGLSAFDTENLGETAKQISDTERRSMTAERDTNDRYLAAWLSERIGAEFAGRISGVQRFGLFIKLDETGADGLIPVRSLGHEFFHFDADAQSLVGSDSGLTLAIGQRVRVRLTEATPVTGGLLLELLDVEGDPLPRRSQRKGRFAPRKPAKLERKRRVIRKRS
ncbi:ribonuclease R [Falsirhodobacter sp. alg1]|uniref:ribonuclease R n=1 Tax=Falsirhodobacter sp. alg1 TaxID=1472418 RepID=UPI0005F09C6B|nr:ribonuclease R [Falsirhodobacter sp. alg1]